jgi:hypothetical protein
MNKEISNWMKDWVAMVNESKQPKEDFWIETPIGTFKNPEFVCEGNDEVGEIDIIQYDE